MTSTGKYRLHVSTKADAMFIGHVAFLAEQSVSAADRLYDDFRDSLKRIKENPKIYQFADDMDAPGIPEKEYRRCVFRKNYKIMYRIEIEDDLIVVEAVLDGRAENKWSAGS